jgi:rhodanese-related sulfurtransferase
MRKLFWLMAIALIGLIGCGGETASVAPDTIDLATLPATIDVQTAAALQDRDDVVLIDVREQWEYDEWHIPNITLIPMSELAARVSEIPTDKTVVVTCNSGNRSGQVTDFLRDNGYESVHNMAGGIQAWNQAGLPVDR